MTNDWQATGYEPVAPEQIQNEVATDAEESGTETENEIDLEPGNDNRAN